MKWPWEYLFDYIYAKYVKLLAEHNKIKKELEKLPIILGDFDFDSKATQKDKASPHSHMQKSEVFVRLGRAYPDSEGFQRFHVANTNSMEPFIDDNSIVVGSTNISGLSKGDIVIYEGKVSGINLLIVHKIISLNTNSTEFYIKGDNNFFADGWVKKEKIRWRVVCVGYAEPQREDD